MATINFKRIRQQVAQQAGPRIAKITDKILDNRYERAREKLLIEIGEDPISQELTAGPNAANFSGTLSREGNLFSFFGFPIGADPVRKLLEYLDQTIKKGPSKRIRGRKDLTFRSYVTIPSLDDIEDSAANKITDQYSNEGWIKGVRQGQAGYGQYIFDVIRQFRTSRSTTGLQLDGIVQQGSMYPQSAYLSSQITNFKRKLKKG